MTPLPEELEELKIKFDKFLSERSDEKYMNMCVYDDGTSEIYAITYTNSSCNKFYVISLKTFVYVDSETHIHNQNIKDYESFIKLFNAPQVQKIY